MHAAHVRRAVVIVLLAFLVAVPALLSATPASACDCASSSVKEYFDRADAVFIGSLASREVEQPGGGSSTDPALHVFTVDSVYKGTAHREQGVVSPQSGASCGLELGGEGPFIVFASRSGHLGGETFTELPDGQYAASLCGGTTQVTPGLEAELEALAGLPADPGITKDPLPGVAGIELASSSRVAPALAGVGAVVVLTALALLLRRRLVSRR